MTITLPIRTVNPLNGAHGHWATRSRRRRDERGLTALFLRKATLPPLPARVTLTRIGKRRMDTDGLAASNKSVRDAIAAQYGVDDGDGRYEWVYQQQIGREYAIRIDIEPIGPAPAFADKLSRYAAEDPAPGPVPETTPTRARECI